MSNRARRWVAIVSRTGIIARGIVLGLCGAFFVAAAWWQDPRQAHEIGGAMLALERQPFGRWLLLLSAIGLAFYAAYEFIRAKFWRARAPKPAAAPPMRGK